MTVSVLAFRSVYAVQRSWSDAEEDMLATRRRLADADLSGVPTPARGVAEVFTITWAGYAGESAGLAAGFVLALSAADYVFHDTDGYVAEQLRHLDGRLGPQR